MPNEELEKPKETCGLILTFEGGVGVKINLKATKEEVIDAIQNRLSAKKDGLIQFQTSNPDEEEVLLFEPKKILAVILKKEFIFSSGRIVPASLASPGVDPQTFKH